jgi:alkylhydroperoxidase family enzyme
MDIENVTRQLVDGAWIPREAAILAAVDQLHADRDLDEEAWAALEAHLDEQERIELLMLAGHYEMLATFLRTLRVAQDESV